MKVIGVTGGIGSGKSTVCAMLQDLGAHIFSADAEARRLMEHDPEIRRRVIDAFGEEAYNASGRLNRSYLADRIFSDDEQRARMNAIVHPAVRDAFGKFVDEARDSGADVVVREAALLTGAEANLDELVVVQAPESLRLDRVRERDGADELRVRARMSVQPSEEEFRRAADRIIVNDGSPADLRRKIWALWKEWTSGNER